MILHWRSIAERGGCFWRNICVCLFVNTITSERLNVGWWNLVGRCIVQKSQLNLNFRDIGPVLVALHSGRTQSLAGELSLSHARLAADGWPLLWVNHPLQVSQPGKLSFYIILGSINVVSWNLMCYYVYDWRSLVKAMEITAGLAENNGSLSPGGLL